MPTEHVTKTELTQVEKEREILTRDIVEKNKKVVILQHVQILQQSIYKNVFTIVVLAESEDPAEKLTKVINDLNISYGELKKN